MLKTNPLVLRFAKSRAQLANDVHLPTYHFVSPENRLNDPNGLCYWRGNWHLFYQGYPPEDKRQHWGHAVSKDLLHWRDLPYAIYPGPEHACFSGSTLVEKDRVIAMYHGTEVGNMVAISDDDLLLNWDKLTNQAVIPIPDTSEKEYKIFDPFIWKKGEYYYSLSGSQSYLQPMDQPVRAHYLFRSKNLIDWEYMHEFVEGDRFTQIGDDGACPYFWPIGDRHMLLFFSHNSGGQYLLGDYDTDNDVFKATSHGKFNFGASRPSGLHAPSASPDGKGGIIVIFNVNKGKENRGWDQIMSLPRRLTLKGYDEVVIEPAGDIESLRKFKKNISSRMIPANREILLEGISGNAIEIETEIDVKDAESFELKVLRSADQSEYTKISFYKEKGLYKGFEYKRGSPKFEQYRKMRYSLISLDTDHSSVLSDINHRPPEVAPVLLGSDENLKLRIFIDKSIVEVFVNGKQCVSARVFPGLNDSLGVSVESRGGDSEIKSLNLYEMNNIYKK
ncbi:glycoside hydrolase family 32 protein [Membranihabitans marinus]